MNEDQSHVLRGGERTEPLSRKLSVIVGNEYSFNTDTILLADYAMPKAGETCADFGTGCGVIPLLWCARSSPSRVWACEIQHAACDMARRSVHWNGLDEVIRVAEGDFRELRRREAIPAGSFDLIACNPPYKEAGTGKPSASQEHRVARHETVCGFSEIAAAVGELLRWGGRFCCCMRPERLCGTLLALRDAGLEPKRLRFVQQRPSSPPFLFLLQANRGGRPGLSVAPALMVEAGGGFSQEMLRIYGDYKEGKT